DECLFYTTIWTSAVLAFKGGTGDVQRRELPLTHFGAVEGGAGSINHGGPSSGMMDATAVHTVQHADVQCGLGSGISILHEEGNAQILIENSVLRNTGRSAIVVRGIGGTAAASSTVDLTIRNNTIQEYANPGSAREGIYIQPYYGNGIAAHPDI